MENRTLRARHVLLTGLAIAGALSLLMWPGSPPQPEARSHTVFAASQDACGEFSPSIQFILQPTGAGCCPSCCWDLKVRNALPGAVCLKPTLTLQASPAFIEFLQVNLAPNWTLSPQPPTPGPLTLTYSGSEIPTGETTIGRFCLNFQNQPSGSLTIQWTVGYGPSACGPYEATCSTTLNLTCPSGCLLCGRKCRDLNGNGECDPSEPLLSNWPITLTDASGNSLTIKTNQQGQFCFFNLAPGLYTISEAVPSGWVAGSVSCTKFIPVQVPGYPKPVDCGQQAGSCQFTCEYREDIQRYDCIMCRFPNLRAEDVAERKECDDRPEILNTGWDDRTQSTISISDPDDEWVVIDDPDPSTSEPRPATVIANPMTKKEPRSEWISADQLGRVRRTGQYVFQRCFCLDPDDLPKASMKLTLWAADEAIVFLNGNQIGTTPPRSYQQPNPTTITVSNGFLRAGLNCLQVVVTGGPTGFPLTPQAGFDLVGEVTAGSDLCCEGGAICGVKFHDANGNGVMDPGERLLPGWPIVLRDNQGTVVRIAVTDRNGAYCFDRLPPGPYVVSEILQPNWRQTYPPPPGTHQVNLDPKKSALHRDFGNRQ